MTTKPKRCAIYLRVSTDEQDTEMQARDLRAYATQRGYVVVDEYADKLSGSTQRRPALDALMNAARKKQFDVVLVWRFDRFARSSKMLVTALFEFKSLGIDFISYSENIDTSSPLGEAIFTIIAAMAQLERDIIRERVRGGIRNARAKGKQLGRPAQVDAAKVARLRARGLSLAEIALQVQSTKSGVSKILKKQAVQVREKTAAE
jgi:DNA invertase Pin-like site-specific DNA recombinase